MKLSFRVRQFEKLWFVIGTVNIVDMKLPEVADHDPVWALIIGQIHSITAQTEDSMRAQRLVSLVRRYTSFDEMIAPLLNEFIEKIVVHEADKFTGDRWQKVDIYFNFIGCFVPPRSEAILTTEEEAKVQKALAARNREQEQNKLRMRRVWEAQRAAKEAEKVFYPAG